MTSTEERLRDAFTGAAQTVRQEDLTPLALAAPRRRHPPRWAVPLVAAASVAVVVVGGLELRVVRHDVVTAPAVPPRFFVSVEAALGKRTKDGQDLKPAVARVRDTVTGRVVASVPSVSGVDWDVSGNGLASAPGGRAYVLRGMYVDAPNTHALYRVFLLRLDAHGLPQPLVELPVSQLRDQVSSFALSPDARRIAFVLDSHVGVADLATGRVRTRPERMNSLPEVQWAPDGRRLLVLGRQSATELWTWTFGADVRGGKVTSRVRISPARSYYPISSDGKEYVVQAIRRGEVSYLRISAINGRITGTLAACTLTPAQARAQAAGYAVDESTGHLLIVGCGLPAIYDLHTGRSRVLPVTLEANSGFAW